MNKNDWTFVQNQIGYTFNNPALLEQAFTRKSYTEENGGENNEVLEFIGDKVLDLIVVKHLIEQESNSIPLFQKHDPAFKRTFAYASGQVSLPEKNTLICDATEGELTEQKKVLVQKKTLAERIDCLGIAKYLIMGKGDISSNATSQASVREDLFESILGAIAIDCNWNINTLQDVVENMLHPETYLEQTDDQNYVKKIEEWTRTRYQEVPQYYFKESSYEITIWTAFDGISQPFSLADPKKNDVRFHCLLKISDSHPIFRGFGQSKTEAKQNVCKVAYEWLIKNKLDLSIRDELENPNKDDSISQLEILARRGYFPIPVYNFSEEHDSNGNPFWICECQITDLNVSFTATASIKKDAKKIVAYEMLQYVLENF